MFAAVAVFGIALAACVEQGFGPSPTDGVTTTTSTTVPDAPTTTIEAREATRAFEACMIDSGVDLAPVSYDARGRPRLDLMMKDVDLSEPEARDAFTVCSELLLLGALDMSGSPIIRHAIVELLTEFSECVRGKGVPDFPDPKSSFNGIGSPYVTAQIPYSDPDLELAVQVCGSRLATSALG